MATTPIPAALSIEGLGQSDARASFDLAAASGYRGIAFATNHSELNPDSLGPSARRHVKTILASKRLSLDAVRAAAPRAGLTNPTTIDRTLENARKAMLLACELGVQTVSLNIGSLAQPAIPEATIIAALRELAQQADASGLTLALAADGGIDPLARILKAVDFDRARIELDASRSIAVGEDPLRHAELAAGLIGQLTASDAVRTSRGIRTVPLGEGQLPLPELAAMLREQGFAGPWVVDVRDLADVPGAARHAAEILGKYLAR